MTTWTPDTDDCQIEISDDPRTKGEIIGFVSKKESKVHATPADVLAENRLKNSVWTEVLRVTEKCVWSIAPDRAVVVTFIESATAMERSDLATSLESKYPGKTRVV